MKLLKYRKIKIKIKIINSFNHSPDPLKSVLSPFTRARARDGARARAPVPVPCPPAHLSHDSNSLELVTVSNRFCASTPFLKKKRWGKRQPRGELVLFHQSARRAHPGGWCLPLQPIMEAHGNLVLKYNPISAARSQMCAQSGRFVWKR